MHDFSGIKSKFIKENVDRIVKNNIDGCTSKAEVARRLGVKPQYLNLILSGGRNVSDKFFKKFTKVFNVNQNDILSIENKVAANQESHSIELNNIGTVPYWNLPVTAGKSITDIVGKIKPDGYIKGLPGADIAENILPVIGASMEPEIMPGALIGVRKINNWETLNTERVYLIITHDDRMIKRIEHDIDNHDILWCVSPNYKPFKIYKSDIIEIQRVCFVYNPK